MADPLAPVVPEEASFPVGYETLRGAFRGTCHLTALGLTLCQGSDTKLTVEWPHLHAADGGPFDAHRPNKIALDVTPTGFSQPILLKLYLNRLTDVETMSAFISRHTSVRMQRGAISSLLHAPRLLPSYSHTLRRAAWGLTRLYRGVLQLALFLYITNMVAVLPEVSIVDMYNWGTECVSWIQAAPVPTRMALLLVVPVMWPLSLIFFPVVMALIAARHCVTIILSLSLARDLTQLIHLYKLVVRLFRWVRTLRASARSEKKFQ